MIFWILFLLLILLGIWFCIEQHVLRVRKQTLSLEHLPAGWDGVSLLQITDLHHRQMGRGNCRIIRQAQQLYMRDFQRQKFRRCWFLYCRLSVGCRTSPVIPQIRP